MSHQKEVSPMQQLLMYENLRYGSTISGFTSHNLMSSVYKLPTQNLDEYYKFFNWNEGELKRYRPKGINYPSFDLTKIHGNVITELQKNSRLTNLAYTKRPIQVKSLYKESPVFLSSG